MKRNPNQNIVKATAAAVDQINLVLDEITKLNREHRGVVAALHTVYQWTVNVATHRQEVELWINPNPRKRRTPHIDTGLKLALASSTVLLAHRKTPFQRRGK